jgi:hypothetical protein
MGFSAVKSRGFNVESGLYGPDDVAACKQFIASLASLPTDTQHIYINALPYPSTTANMMPIPDGAINRPPKGQLWGKYENRFGFNYATLTRNQLKTNNGTLRDLAKFIKTTIQKINDPRIHIVPIDEGFVEYDYKTNRKAQFIPAPDDQRKLSNITIDSYKDMRGHHWYGGLIGLDGMHPTIVGYNLMARMILDTIKKFEPTLKIPNSLPTVAEAYQADTLVKNIPDQWHFLLYTWRNIRKAFNCGLALPDDEGTRSVNSLMSVVSKLGSGPARKSPGASLSQNCIRYD